MATRSGLSHRSDGEANKDEEVMNDDAADKFREKTENDDMASKLKETETITNPTSLHLKEGSELTVILQELLMQRKQDEERRQQDEQWRRWYEEKRIQDEERRERQRIQDEEQRIRVEERRDRERSMELATLVKTLEESRLNLTQEALKLTKLSESDDIEAFLTTFERTMKSYAIPEKHWACRLGPQLTGKAQEAFAAMDQGDSSKYKLVKEAILKRYNITLETYRERFRSMTKKTNESFRELSVRMSDVARKWTKECKDKDELLQLVMLEQLQSVVPDGVRIHLREKKPKTMAEAGDLADAYVEARREEGLSRHTLASRPSLQPTGTGSTSRKYTRLERFCDNCGRSGHNTENCWGKRRQNSTGGADGQDKVQTPRQDDKKQGGSTSSSSLSSGNLNGKGAASRGQQREVKCFKCNGYGHLSYKCPNQAYYASNFTRSPVPFVLANEQRNVFEQPESCKEFGVERSGLVNGTPASDIVLDTGCSQTMVHRRFVEQDDILPGEVQIRCAHGDISSYPVANINFVVNGLAFTAKAGVSSTLPTSVLLGRDVPVLHELLTENPVFAVTRAQARAEQKAAVNQVREFIANAKSLEEDCDTDRCTPTENENDIAHAEVDSAQTTTGPPTEDPQMIMESENDSLSTGDPCIDWLQDFNLDLDVNGGRRGPRKSRRDRRKDKIRGNTSKYILDISGEEFQVLQKNDPTLRHCWQKARQRQSESSEVTFQVQDDLLYRHWRPALREDSLQDQFQLVLPVKCRQRVMEIAHSIPMAGHLGRDKTVARILQRFYWPGFYSDVERFCATCSECQKTARPIHQKVPMVSIPVVSEPFHRIAMDLVGPLERTRKGNKFILVIVDYATRYPEAIPLKTIDAETIAEELVKVFARVGIPEELLTDQGSNFTSELMRQVTALLRISQIRTTPYHPQTDGVVERFNGTLKAMLRKFAREAPQSWDELLPFLLFAYREVPQASTGFSPFQLLYGRHVRGPLDIVREIWEGDQEAEPTNVLTYVLKMHDCLMSMTNLVQANLTAAQEKQKTFYDRTAHERKFQAGDQVLLLLPTSPKKLQAAWHGPYTVIRKVGKVDYEIEMPNRRKKRNIFHVNMLRLWKKPALVSIVDHVLSDLDSSSSSSVEDQLDEVSATSFFKPSSPFENITVNPDLTSGEREELFALLHEFEDIFSPRPGRTDLVTHHIHTGDAKPIRQRPYPIPHAYREGVAKELAEMEELGIISPSTSEWSSPIIIVSKPDGSLRLCVDYRNLNRVSKFDAYPMPRIDDILDNLGTAQYITTLDLTKGYWQIPIGEDSREKTAFSTPNGLFQFNVMPFGLHGAPATFQRAMDNMLRDERDCSDAYLDDLTVKSADFVTHIH